MGIGLPAQTCRIHPLLAAQADPRMKAGTLNRRIRLERPMTEKKPSGQVVTTGWELVAAVWANARVLNGKEFITSGTEVASTAVSFRIRWRTDVTTEMRVVYASVAYDINAVLPDLAGRKFVDLACTAGERMA